MQWGGNERFYWKLTIEALRGGLLIGTDVFMLLAPEAGYQRQLQFETRPENASWSEKQTFEFYVRTRDRFYGKVKLELFARSSEKTVIIMYESWLNPSGGRELEYDPLQYVGDEVQLERLNAESYK